MFRATEVLLLLSTYHKLTWTSMHSQNATRATVICRSGDECCRGVDHCCRREWLHFRRDDHSASWHVGDLTCYRANKPFIDIRPLERLRPGEILSDDFTANLLLTNVTNVVKFFENRSKMLDVKTQDMKMPNVILLQDLRMRETWKLRTTASHDDSNARRSLHTTYVLILLPTALHTVRPTLS